MLVTVPLLEVYQEPEQKNVVDEVLYGHSVECLSFGSQICEVQTEGLTRGFVKTRALWDVVPPPDLWRANYRADVLASPDIKSEKLFVLPRFSRVQVLALGEEFLTVRLFSGKIGYVHRAHLSLSVTELPTADAVCDTALSLLGTPYRWGGTSDLALDCSGLVFLAFSFWGVNLPRSTAQMHVLPEVSAQTARRGDLVLFDSHVGLLLTKTTFLHASAFTGFVAVSSLDPTHPLYDTRHAPAGYTIRRVL
ncbi:MAG: C40 family peptidase [Clostridia bacterium]|nr:C40 family peptidase [Clostridia bacterium]